MKFSIDFTGGSIWEIKFANQESSPAQVRAILAGQGVTDATVTATSDGYILIKTAEPLGLRPAEAAPNPERGSECIRLARQLGGGRSRRANSGAQRHSGANLCAEPHPRWTRDPDRRQVR
jgi:preprotein translocase subunit SecD